MSVSADAPRSIGALIAGLGGLALRFSPPARAEKLRRLRAIGVRPIRSAQSLLRLHETLCLVQAYPDDREVLDAVERELSRVAARVRALPPREARRLEETGLAGTTVSPPLSLAMATWLAGRYSSTVGLDLDDADTADALGALLPRALGILEEEALVEAGVVYRDWRSLARPGRGGSKLGWLLSRLRRDVAGAAVYDQRQPRLRWRLGSGGPSRTLARLPDRPTFFFHRGPLRRRGGPLGRRLPGRPVPTRSPGAAEASALLDAARAAMAIRYREVHGLSFADPGDVTIAGAGRGVELVWFGVAPRHRLPLRAHYAYLVLKNGVPIGYGDASLLFDWCEIAFNVFETFRGGESGWIFARLLGLVCHHWGARAFQLAPYQLGHDNAEALTSGAFWFYWKLGFRPVRAVVERLVQTERRRLRQEAGARSSRSTLLRLAAGPMALRLPVAAAPAIRGLDAGRLGRRAALHRGEPEEVARALRASGWRAWPPGERIAFERLAPFFALAPDLPRWPPAARRALIGLARAKGSGPEREYLRRLRAHARLRTALLPLAEAES